MKENKEKNDINRRDVLRAGATTAAVVAVSGPASLMAASSSSALPVVASSPAADAIVGYIANMGAHFEAAQLLDIKDSAAMNAVSAAKVPGGLTSPTAITTAQTKYAEMVETAGQAVDPLLDAAKAERGIFSEDNLRQVFGGKGYKPGMDLLPEVQLPDGRILNLVKDDVSGHTISVYDPQFEMYVADIHNGQAMQFAHENIGELMQSPQGRRLLHSFAQNAPEGELKRGFSDILRMNDDEPVSDAAKKLLGREDFEGSMGDLRQDVIRGDSITSRKYRELLKDNGIDPDAHEQQRPSMDKEKALESWKAATGLNWTPILNEGAAVAYTAEVPQKYKESGWKKMSVPADLKPYVIKASVDQLAMEEGRVLEMRMRINETAASADTIVTLTVRIPEELFLDEAYLKRVSENLRDKKFLENVKEEAYWNAVVKETDSKVQAEEHPREKNYLERSRKSQGDRVSALHVARLMPAIKQAKERG